ncbi:MAG: hypothetical protein H6710_17270 [Myxococcales bacterium]|nr:hypothetical protein [Myxococcales bacterium]
MGHVDDADEGGAAALDALARLGAPTAEDARSDASTATPRARWPRSGASAARRRSRPCAPASGSRRRGRSPALLAHVGAAVDLLWHLCADDRDAREALLTRLGDRDVTPAILGDLGGGLSPQEAALLARRERTRGRAARSLSDEVAALDGLTRLESAALLPAIGEHLRAIVSAVAAGAIDDEALHGEAQRIAPARALAALRGLGAALWRRGGSGRWPSSTPRASAPPATR